MKQHKKALTGSEPGRRCSVRVVLIISVARWLQMLYIATHPASDRGKLCVISPPATSVLAFFYPFLTPWLAM